MKPIDLEPGSIYLGTAGPFREIVMMSHGIVTYRKSGDLEIRHMSDKAFRKWALSDVTEVYRQMPVLAGKQGQVTRKVAGL